MRRKRVSPFVCEVLCLLRMSVRVYPCDTRASPVRLGTLGVRKA